MCAGGREQPGRARGRGEQGAAVPGLTSVLGQIPAQRWGLLPLPSLQEGLDPSTGLLGGREGELAYGEGRPPGSGFCARPGGTLDPPRRRASTGRGRCPALASQTCPQLPSPSASLDHLLPI